MVFPFFILLAHRKVTQSDSRIREIFAFAIRNPAQGINNFTNDRNPEASPWNWESGIPSVEFRVQDRLKLHYMRRLAPQSGANYEFF